MVFETHHAELKTHPYAEHLPAIEQAIRVVVTPTLQMAEKTRYVIPGAESNALVCSLACIPFVDGLRLCHVDYDGSIYCLDENLPYVTAGSGKINADPFIRFIWDVFWPEPGHLPPLREAIFAAYWTVQMNIEYQSTGVGIGVDVWTVNRNGDGSYAATETDRARLGTVRHVHREHEAGHACAARPHLRPRRSRGGSAAEAVTRGRTLPRRRAPFVERVTARVASDSVDGKAFDPRGHHVAGHETPGRTDTGPARAIHRFAGGSSCFGSMTRCNAREQLAKRL